MGGWDDTADVGGAAGSNFAAGAGWDDAPQTPGVTTAGPDTGGAGAPWSPASDAALPLGDNPDPEALLAALRSWPDGRPPRFDGSAVTRLSMPALQVILAAIRDAAATGGRLIVQDPSFAFTLAFEAFGFGGADEPFTSEYT